MKLLKLKNLVIGQVYNTILVIIDKLTKWGYFIAYIEEISVKDIAQVYIKEVFARHKALNKIISNGDPRFISAFWEVFLAEQGVRAATSTVYYLQIDSQTERLN